MEKVLSLLIVTVVVAPSTASDLSECLELAGINVTTNLIERTFENYTAYVDINFQWQERGGYRLPLAYLKVQSASDVQFAVKCARSHGLAVVARAGGHGYLKYAYGQHDDQTLVLDLQNLNAISVDQERRIATVEAGARLGHVAYQLWQNGNFLIPIGTCASVGVSGYTLGGGHSLFSYLYGMGSDNVIEMEMVDANGELLTINNRTNVNLFWALRGAGVTGSFGIVTKFTYQMHAAPHQIVQGIVGFSLQRFNEFYSVYQTFMSENRGRPIFYGFTVHEMEVTGIFFDVQSATEAESVSVSRIEEVLALFPSPDSQSVVMIIQFRELLTDFLRITRDYGYLKPNFNLTEPSDLMKINSYGTGTEWFKSKSFFVRKLLNPDEILALQQLLIDVSVPSIHIGAETFAGKMQDFDAQNDSVFLHRDAYYYVYIYMVREKDDDPETSIKLNDFFERSKEVLNHTNSYQNYPDDEMDDFLERYYGVNLQRLIDIKTDVDPDDFFNTNPQSIPVRSGSGSGYSFKNSRLKSIAISLCVFIVMTHLLQRK
ncbi:hypothetical protein HA402_014548 [Bradysia odoriphaga]|nr:hypothetical protein HA402_014548 [Bradysia odoriphaga]